MLYLFFLIFKHVLILSRDSGQRPQLPVSPVNMRVNNRHTYNHSGPRQPLCFSLSVPYSINYTRESTLHYKIGFVLDGFAQLQVNVSILSTIKVGQAKLQCLVG